MQDQDYKRCEGCGATFYGGKRKPAHFKKLRFCSNQCWRDQRPLELRFEEKVDRSPGHGPDGDCHVWTSPPTVHGYGKFYVDGASKGAHVAAWFVAHGDWPTECVLHRCDNRLCVNSEHLFLGSHADNSADMVAKGRQHRGEACHTSVLTRDQVLEIRASSEPRADLAERYGVSKYTITDVRSGRRWRWL